MTRNRWLLIAAAFAVYFAMGPLDAHADEDEECTIALCFFVWGADFNQGDTLECIDPIRKAWTRINRGMKPFSCPGVDNSAPSNQRLTMVYYGPESQVCEVQVGGGGYVCARPGNVDTDGDGKADGAWYPADERRNGVALNRGGRKVRLMLMKNPLVTDRREWVLKRVGGGRVPPSLIEHVGPSLAKTVAHGRLNVQVGDAVVLNESSYPGAEAYGFKVPDGLDFVVPDISKDARATNAWFEWTPDMAADVERAKELRRTAHAN